jgi:hypothetical protein
MSATVTRAPHEAAPSSAHDEERSPFVSNPHKVLDERIQLHWIHVFDCIQDPVDYLGRGLLEPPQLLSFISNP